MYAMMLADPKAVPRRPHSIAQAAQRRLVRGRIGALDRLEDVVHRAHEPLDHSHGPPT